MLDLIHQLESDVEEIEGFVRRGYRMVQCDASRDLVTQADERVRLMRVTLAELRVAARKRSAAPACHDYQIVPFLAKEVV